MEVYADRRMKDLSLAHTFSHISKKQTPFGNFLALRVEYDCATCFFGVSSHESDYYMQRAETVFLILVTTHQNRFIPLIDDILSTFVFTK